MTNNQSGNVLFYILIAVALLAALSYTVTQSGRGGTSRFSREDAGIAASEIIEYGNVLGNAVSQLRLRGYKDTELSFESNSLDGYTNPNCSEDGCKVFHINGGGVSYITPNEKWLDSSSSAQDYYGDMSFYGQACTEDLTCYSDGDDNEDLIVFLPFLNKAICVAINDKLGITNPLDDAPVDAGCSGSAVGKFVGVYSESTALMDGAGDISRTSGCFKQGACSGINDTYHYYKVLIER